MTYGSIGQDSGEKQVTIDANAWMTLSAAEHAQFKRGEPIIKRTGDSQGDIEIRLQMIRKPALRCEKCGQAVKNNRCHCPVVRKSKKKHEPIPKNWPVQPLRSGQKAEDKTTCGTCGLSWDDGKVTSMTPAPAARCPFEQFHIYPKE